MRIARCAVFERCSTKLNAVQIYIDPRFEQCLIYEVVRSRLLAFPFLPPMNFDQPIYIVDGVRTPFAKMGTAFAETDAVELGRVAVAELLAKTGLDPATIEEVIFGCVAQPADAANIARVIALRAGVPDTVSAVTVHRNCASGFESVTQAAEKMMVGRGDVFMVGGTENMTLVPLLFSAAAAKKFTALARAKTCKEKLAVAASFRPEDFKPRIGLQMGLSDPVSGLNMGQTAENVARDFGITREDQDQFALGSHLKAVAAQDKLKEEITPGLSAEGPQRPGVSRRGQRPAQGSDHGGAGQAAAGVREGQRHR